MRGQQGWKEDLRTGSFFLGSATKGDPRAVFLCRFAGECEPTARLPGSYGANRTLRRRKSGLQSQEGDQKGESRRAETQTGEAERQQEQRQVGSSFQSRIVADSK